MEDLRKLTEFISYCEEVKQETNDLWLLSLIAANSTKEEFLQDITKSLETYYKFLQISIKNEMYLNAGTIWNAKSIEMDHYNELGLSVFKKSIKKDINLIDKKLKLKYL